MARPSIPIGTHGAVNTRAFVDGTWYAKSEIPDGAKPTKWSASTRFGDADGTVNPVKRQGTSETKAKTNLEKACAERIGSRATRLAADSRFHEIAALWIERIRIQEKGTTYDTYRKWLTHRVIPAFGNVRIRLITVARLQDYFDLIATEPLPATGKPLSANSRRVIRTVISGVLQYAIRRELLKTNPVRDMERIRSSSRKKPRAYDRGQAAAFFAKVDADKVARRGQLDQLLRFAFNSGCRLGEVLALRWQELNLTENPVKVSDPIAGDMEIPPHSAWVSGNIVRVAGKGLLRHEGKTDGSQRIVGLPPALVTMLLVQRPVGADDYEPVFPSTIGGWREPSTVGLSIQRLCARIGVEGFTSHVARKTYATALDSAGQSARQIANALGKTSVSDTQDVYLGRDIVNMDAAALLDDFFRPAGS